MFGIFLLLTVGHQLVPWPIVASFVPRRLSVALAPLRDQRLVEALRRTGAGKVVNRYSRVEDAEARWWMLVVTWGYCNVNPGSINPKRLLNWEGTIKKYQIMTIGYLINHGLKYPLNTPPINKPWFINPGLTSPDFCCHSICYTMFYWLVIWNMFLLLHNIWDNPWHWLFFRGVKTTNQYML